MWKKVKLGEVVSYEKSNGQGSKLPYLGMENISSETMKQVGELSIPDQTSTTFLFNEKHVLYGRLRPYLKKVFLPTFQGQCSTEIFCLNPKPLLMREYLAYWLLSSEISNKIDQTSTGARMPRANMSAVLEFEFPLPPLREQQRIVEKLDRAFEEIDRAIEATEYAQLSLASFQESRVKDYFVNNITGAQVVPLAQVAEYFNGLTYSPKDVSESGTIVLRSSNIQNGEMSYADIVRVDKEIKEKLIVRDSDILVCSRNGSKALIGKSALIGYAEEKMTFGTFMMIIRSSYNNYLQWFFKSSLFRSQIVQGENTMINQITRYMLDKVTLPFPPEDIQRKIASELSDIDAQVRALAEVYSRKKNSLNALKSAILAQELKGPES